MKGRNIGRKTIRPRVIFSNSIIQFVLIIWCIFQLYPIIWMFYSSLKTTTEINKNPFGIPLQPHWENFKAIWENPYIGNPSLLVYFKNSIIINVSTLIFLIFFSILAAWAIAKFRFFGKNFFLLLLIILLAIPIHSFILPLYYMMVKFNLANTYFAVIFPYIASLFPFTVVVLQAYFKSFPNELIEAARIDGCSEFRILFTISVPLSKGIISALVIINFISVWNEFLMAFVLIKDKYLKTLNVGLYQYIGVFKTDWGWLLASLSFAFIIPVIVYVMFSRQIMEGMTLGAIKE